jgi:hypothetical protein
MRRFASVDHLDKLRGAFLLVRSSPFPADDELEQPSGFLGILDSPVTYKVT